jgi:hypothetical protein
MTLAGMLGPVGMVTRAEITAHLDRLDAQTRVDECLVLSKQQLKLLWHLASTEPGEAQELVGQRGTAVFAGRNSLRLFTRFEKRFSRNAGAIIGYNAHSLRRLIGPGYFTVTVAQSGLLFDYSKVPGQAPDGWPRITPNTQGFAKPVYGGLLDDAVWMARDVIIGSARRGDISLDSYFVLARV